jgi:subfamily B ATP-binding cassette protein MsbA
MDAASIATTAERRAGTVPESAREFVDGAAPPRDATAPAERTAHEPANEPRLGVRAPTAEPPAPMSLPAAGRRLVRYLWPYRWTVGGAIACFFTAAAMEPAAPALLKYLLDHGFEPTPGFPIWIVPIVVVALFAVRGAANYGGAYLFATSTSKAVLALRHDLVHAIMRAEASLYTRLSPGVATARVINEPQNAIGALTQATTTILRDGISFIVLLGYLFYLNWRLTLVSLVVAPLVAIVIRRVKRRIINVSARTYESQVRLTGIIDDISRAWRVVRTFDAAGFEQRRFGDEAERLRLGTVRSASAGAMMSPLTQLVASLGVALILTIALYEASQGRTTIGEFVAFITALMMLSAPLRRLADLTQPIVASMIQARACFELIDTPPEPDLGTLEIDRARGELTVEGLTVVHPGADRPALRNVTLHVPAGQTVALVGPSGSGKTTLVNTLLGFVEPTAGRVLFDDVRIEAIRKASLRRQFAVVSQDIVLFDASIEANVVYAQPYDAARVEACLRAAHLWEFVSSLPDGMRAPVGTNGNLLSGGQRQRLAIARALYKEAQVWIFDEATSALDSESERAVHEAIAAQRGARTLILIAHRLSTIRHADCIHVLDDARLVESGPHERLLAADGRYAAMVRAQALH